MVEKLLNFLGRGASDAVDKLVWALRESDQEYAANIIVEKRTSAGNFFNEQSSNYIFGVRWKPSIKDNHYTALNLSL